MSTRVRVSAPRYLGAAVTASLHRVAVTLVASTVAVVGAIVLSPDDALAACSPATGSNVTVNCTGTTFNQGPGINTGYGDSTQNGLTVNVQSGASVTGTSTGIDVNNNNTINNLGTITTQGSGGIGDVFGINGNGPVTVNNSGTIGRADAVNNIFDLAGINALGGLTLTNQAGGVIQGGLGIQDGGTGIIVNSGLITAIGGGGDAINWVANPSSVTVTNNVGGTITGDASGIRANTATIFNSGTISAPTFGGTGIVVDNLNLTNSGDGGAVSGSQTPILTITNFGKIIGGIDTGGSGAIQGNVVNLTNSGTVSVVAGGGGPAISMNNGTIVNNAGGTIAGDFTAIVAFNNTSIFNAGTITANNGDAILFASVGIGGGGNTLTLGPGFVINGNVVGSGTDTFQLGGSGGGTFDLSTIGASQRYRGFTTFNVVGAVWTVNNTYTQTDPWTVQAGVLLVNGNLSSATSLTVTGGRLGGTGTIGNTQINSGGTFAPGSGTAGTSITVAGNLAFKPCATYLNNLNPTMASIANITGTAALAGGVLAVFGPGSYAKNSYDILHAAGGLGGTKFGSLSLSNPNFTANLSYTATDVFLNLTGVTLGGGTSLNGGQQGVAGAINNAINGGGALPPGLAGLLGLTGNSLASALSQLNGEVSTGAERAAFQLTDQFLELQRVLSYRYDPPA
jgi:hypothetical protein